MRYIFCLLLLCAVQATAQVDAREAIVEIGGKEKTIHCVEGESGRLRTRNGNERFIPFKKIIRARRKKARTGNKKARRQMRKFRKLRKEADPACRSLEEENSGGGSNNGGGSQTAPTPTPTATPSPTAESYFERNGDVTALGASVFEMPEGIQANAFRGQTVYNMNCTGCHAKRSRPTYPLLRTAIAGSPMFYTEELMSDLDAADLTAYLNIFRTPETD